MSPYINQCMLRAKQSVEELRATGKEPTALEISSDVWTYINMGGINIFPGQKIFFGLEVLEMSHLEDHIKAV